jgi:citrate lyase subunit beta/citryl-CoA lyase
MSAARSMLFMPATRPDLVSKAARCRPDLVVLDLEDAVSGSDKDSARERVSASTAELGIAGVAGLVRVNPAGSRHFSADVEAVLESDATGLVLPKAEDVDAVASLRTALGADRMLVAGIETGRGVAECRALLVAGVDVVYFGAEDYIADVGGRRTESGTEVLYARSMVLLAARLAGVTAVDQAVVVYDDDHRFLADAETGRDIGYDGKLCVHPRQVPLAHRVFSPSADEVEYARAVLDAAAGGASSVDGHMVDEPHVRMARDVLSRAANE